MRVAAAEQLIAAAEELERLNWLKYDGAAKVLRAAASLAKYTPAEGERSRESARWLLFNVVGEYPHDLMIGLHKGGS